MTLKYLTRKEPKCPRPTRLCGYQIAIASWTLLDLWNDNSRFKAGYLEQFPDTISLVTVVTRWWRLHIITGRVDDVINGGTSSLQLRNGRNCIIPPTAAECAVIGINDALKGQIPIWWSKLNDSIEHFQLEQEIIKLVRQQIGAVASLRNVVIVERLPKTRSERPSEN
jgi:propionyl-CoA synthetase